MSATTNLNDFLSKKTTVKNVSITIRLKKDNKPIISQKITIDEFKGGIPKFAKIVNNLTLPYMDETCYITVNQTEIEFIGGKFANTTTKLARFFVDNVCKFNTVDTEARKQARKVFFDFLESNCDDILHSIELLKLIEKSNLKQLANFVKNSDIKLLSND